MSNIRKRSLVLTGLAVAGLVAFNQFNGPPKPSKASGEDPMADYVLLGINNENGALVRYNFADQELTTLGNVTIDGSIPTGIGAAAYVPGFTNLFAFWTDPSDELTKLVYVHTRDGTATVMGQDLGANTIGGAVAVQPIGQDHHTVFAVQNRLPIDFAINGDDLVPAELYAAKITVLGAAITAGGAYDMPVTVEITANGNVYEPFGPFDTPLDGDVNHDHNPTSFVLPDQYAADSSLTIKARSWLMDSGKDGDKNSEWSEHMTVDTSVDSNVVYVIRDGDDVPDITPFMDQASIPDFIQNYIDTETGTAVLDENQVIYLVELGNTSGSGADFQDLVLLVTLAKEPTELGTAGMLEDVLVGGELNINPNNSTDNEFTVTLSEGGSITRDELHEDATTDADGLYYSGAADLIRVKPKGNGSQNTLKINGTAYEFTNANLHVISGNDMEVTIYNDHKHADGRAMGHWWISISGTGVSVQVEDSDDSTLVDVAPPSHLIQVDHQTGETNEIMELSRRYDSLASTDGENFYATKGSDLYVINSITLTEVLVGSAASRDMQSMENAGSILFGFDVSTSQLLALNTATGAAVGSPLDIGVTSLGTFVFTPQNKDTSSQSNAFD